MVQLDALEFYDCAIDGPYFREKLAKHEKYLKKSSSHVSDIMACTDKVFKLFENQKQAFGDLTECLDSYHSFLEKSSGSVANVECEETMKNSLRDFSCLLEELKRVQNDIFLPVVTPIREEIKKLKEEWLGGKNTDAKLFAKDTQSFNNKLEKFLSCKPKDPSQFSVLDQQIQEERNRYMQASFIYMANVQEAEERVQFDLIRTMCLFFNTLRNYHRSALDTFENSKTVIDKISGATWNAEQLFLANKDMKEELMNKLLRHTEWEQIGPSVEYLGREGYLFAYHKKTVASSWAKYFCIFHKDQMSFDMIPFWQGKTSEITVEKYTVKLCIKGVTDFPNLDRRFCFEMELCEKSNPVILQAQSANDFEQWISVLGGKEPIYAARTAIVRSKATQLDVPGYNFVRNLTNLVEDIGLGVQGIYRLSASDQRVKQLVECLRKHSLQMEAPVVRELLADCDAITLACVVKHYIRNLHEPLIPTSLYEDFVRAGHLTDNAQRLQLTQEIFQKLPKLNYQTLCLLIQHLKRIHENNRLNSMNAGNLAIVFAPSILRPREESVAAIMNTKFTTVVLKQAILECDQLFPYPPAPISQPPEQLSTVKDDLQSKSNSTKLNTPSKHPAPPILPVMSVSPPIQHLNRSQTNSDIGCFPASARRQSLEFNSQIQIDSDRNQQSGGKRTTGIRSFFNRGASLRGQKLRISSASNGQTANITSAIIPNENLNTSDALNQQSKLKTAVNLKMTSGTISEIKSSLRENGLKDSFIQTSQNLS